MKNSRNYWTEENIRKLVKDYNISSRSLLIDFKKDNIKGRGAYDAAKRLGILDDLFGKIDIIHWTKEMCEELALKCKTRSEFNVKYKKAYDAAKRHGWFDEIVSHMPEWTGLSNERKYIYVIYAYEELSTHSVYVGLTNNIERRDKEHRNLTKYKPDKLFNFCKLHNVDIPKPKILKDKLTAETAREYEKKFWYQYRDDGWNMINGEFALGYLGSKFNKYWDELRIRDYLTAHPEIKGRSDFNDCCSAGYKKAQELGLLDDLFGPNEHKPYTKEDIYEFMKQHPEIKNREDLRSAAAGVFKAAWRFSMLDEFFGEAINRVHTVDELMTYMSEHPEIKTRADLRKSSMLMFHVAEKNKLLKEIFGERQNKPYTKEDILEFILKHPEIKRRKDLIDASDSIYRAAKRFDMLLSLFGDSLTKSYTEEEVRMYMKEHPEIRRIEDLRTTNDKILCAIRKYNLIDEFFPVKYLRADAYNEEDIRKYLSEHPEINTRNKLLESNKRMYYRARELKLFKELFEDGRTLGRKWTKETIIQYLKDNPNIKRRVDLMNKARGAYYRACQLKILDELFPNIDQN